MKNMTTTDVKTIHVLMIEDKKLGCWSAQCLEHDIATQAKTMTALLREVKRVLDAHVVVSEKLGIEPFANLKEAPPVFWKLYYSKTATASVQPIPSGQALLTAPVEARVAELSLCG